MKKVHILCDSPKTRSGFSVVGKNIALQLKKLGYGVSMTGFQTTHESEWVHNEADNSVIEVMPTFVQYIDELSKYIENVQKINPDVVLCIFNGDDPKQNQYATMMKPTVWYCPVEGRNISELMIRDLKSVQQINGGKVVAQCKWGENEFRKHGLDTLNIYHGYDPEIFRNLKKTPKFSSLVEYENVNLIRFIDNKWTLLKVEPKFLDNEFGGKFIFGFVGANHGLRKKIERLLKAYSIFLKDSQRLKDRTLLVLRTMPISITGINLIKICEDLDIGSNVVFLYGDNNRLSDESMNVIYNCFDVNVSTSGSEGFGLPTLESMACGVPQIGTNCSSFIELIRDNSSQEKHRGLIANKGLWHVMPDMSERFLVDEENFAEKMHTMYAREEFREFCGKNAEEWAKQYTWERVAKKWDELLKSMV